VGTDDIRNIDINVTKSNEIEGHVVMSDGSSFPSGFKALAELTPMAALYPEDVGSWEDVNVDGTFTLSGVDGVRYAVTTSSLPPAFAVVDVRQAGKSIYDEGIVAGAKQQPLEIVLSRNAGSVEVRVSDEKKQPALAAVVALVPTKDHLRNPEYYKRTTFDENKSRYRPIEGIVPGEYMLYAWDDIPDGAEQSAQFIYEFEGRGVRIVVGPNEHLNVEVPLIVTSN
jgi:hypothetical protein